MIESLLGAWWADVLDDAAGNHFFRPPFRFPPFHALAHSVTSTVAPSSIRRAVIRAMFRASSIPRWWRPSRGSCRCCSMSTIPPFHPKSCSNGLLMLQYCRSTGGISSPFRALSLGSICPRSGSPQVTARTALSALPTACGSHRLKLASTCSSGSAASTCVCVMEVSSVQKSVSTGRSVGRTKWWNSATGRSERASRSTHGHSMISLHRGCVGSSRAQVASKSRTRKCVQPWRAIPGERALGALSRGGRGGCVVAGVVC
mmetsp:Transcript_21982/g.54773  ORF Transcript_21982/g.54773 Transcript_21982/m.54773 type:complete len:259 (+) Transcript_21982:35-811(+)